MYVECWMPYAIWKWIESHKNDMFFFNRANSRHRLMLDVFIYMFYGMLNVCLACTGTLLVPCSLFAFHSFFYDNFFLILLQTPFPSAFFFDSLGLLIFAWSFVHFETFNIDCVDEWHLHLALLLYGFLLFVLFNFSSVHRSHGVWVENHHKNLSRWNIGACETCVYRHTTFLEISIFQFVCGIRWDFQYIKRTLQL